MKYFFVIVFVLCVTVRINGNPPHCTTVTKDTDYPNRYKFDYQVVYIHPGQREGYQKLFCIHPPAVNKAVTTACDWAAPPQVEFTLGDDYVHVVRQDPSGRFYGDTVIKTYQFCSHNNLTEPRNDVVVSSLYI